MKFPCWKQQCHLSSKQTLSKHKESHKEPSTKYEQTCQNEATELDDGMNYSSFWLFANSEDSEEPSHELRSFHPNMLQVHESPEHSLVGPAKKMRTSRGIKLSESI